MKTENRVEGLGFRVLGLGFWGLGFRVWGLGDLVFCPPPSRQATPQGNNFGRIETETELRCSVTGAIMQPPHTKPRTLGIGHTRLGMFFMHPGFRV